MEGKENVKEKGVDFEFVWWSGKRGRELRMASNNLCFETLFFTLATHLDLASQNYLRKMLCDIENYQGEDPLQPWLRCIEWANQKLGIGGSRAGIKHLLYLCVNTFLTIEQYRRDIRYLKVWIRYADACPEQEDVFSIIEENQIGQNHSLFYIAYATHMEARKKFSEAYEVYKRGFERHAEPIGSLVKMYNEFLDRLARFAMQKVQKMKQNVPQRINPWGLELIDSLLKNLQPPLLQYEGYYGSDEKYNGKTSLSSLKNGGQEKMLELGCHKYRVKGCIGQGAFARVFRANIEEIPEKICCLKIQRPAWPWEFYIYRQLDKRIPKEERQSFGYASRFYGYADSSIMVCNYCEHGTLQDVVNSYLVIGEKMDEVLCMYYTIEMLRMLETLHSAGIIHGDFKPDNLLIRHESKKWEEWAPCRPGCWREQGVCLVDWGRSIDLKLFPDSTEFEGDCKTSGFRCIEMQQNKPWTYQVDTYGLCVVVHMMLHGSYMDIAADKRNDNETFYRPKAPFKRYWNCDLWKNLFYTLLNVESCSKNPSLCLLREGFEKYLTCNPNLSRKLKQLLIKQSIRLYSSK